MTEKKPFSDKRWHEPLKPVVVGKAPSQTPEEKRESRRKFRDALIEKGIATKEELDKELPLDE